MPRHNSEMLSMVQKSRIRTFKVYETPHYEGAAILQSVHRLAMGWSPDGVKNCREGYLRITHPPVRWVPGALSPGVKRPGCQADSSPPTSRDLYILSMVLTALWNAWIVVLPTESSSSQQEGGLHEAAPEVLHLILTNLLYGPKDQFGNECLYLDACILYSVVWR